MTRYRLIHIPTGLYTELIVSSFLKENIMYELRRRSCLPTPCPRQVDGCFECPWNDCDFETELEYTFEEIKNEQALL